jgi:hypothetical protein
MKEPRNKNCLLTAMQISSPKYAATLAILPIVFLIVELIKVIYELWIPEEYTDASDTIKNTRVVLSVITSAFFLFFAAGGAVEYSVRDHVPETMSIWWIIEGIAGFGAFLVLAIFQWKDFPAGGEIWESVWFWFGMIFFISFLSWAVLSRGKLRLPDDNLWLSIKIIGLIIIGFWLGYRPADTKYDNASFIIFVVMIILAFLFISRRTKTNKGKESHWYMALVIWFIMPIILIVFSFWKGDADSDDKTLGYVYFIALIISILAYVSEVGAYYLKGFKLIEGEDEYNQLTEV